MFCFVFWLRLKSSAIATGNRVEWRPVIVAVHGRPLLCFVCPNSCGHCWPRDIPPPLLPLKIKYWEWILRPGNRERETNGLQWRWQDCSDRKQGIVDMNIYEKHNHSNGKKRHLPLVWCVLSGVWYENSVIFVWRASMTPELRQILDLAEFIFWLPLKCSLHIESNIMHFQICFVSDAFVEWTVFRRDVWHFNDFVMPLLDQSENQENLFFTLLLVSSREHTATETYKWL